MRSPAPCNFVLFTGLTFLLHVISFVPSLAQQTVTGTVLSEENGEPLAGATVKVIETGLGVSTDDSGQFSITLSSADQVLEFSYTGFTSQEVALLGRASVIIALSPAAYDLETIVVTGYSTQRKGDITGAVSVVELENVQRIQAGSFTQKLEGQVAGLHLYTSGAPGAPTNVRIRGISSFIDNTPLFVVDGVPLVENDLTWLNPNDIESIQVLKDASASSIYGSRANNGVLILTTHQGMEGRTRVAYDAYAGVQVPVGNYDEIMITDPLEYGQYFWQREKNAGRMPDSTYFGSGPEPVLPTYIWPIEALENGTIDESSYSYPDNNIIRTNPEGTNWWDIINQPALMTEHQLRVSGGSERGTFSLSGGYFKQDGTQRYSGFERYSFRANSQIKAKAFTFGENISLAYSQNQLQANQNWGGTGVNLMLPVYDIAGNFAETYDGSEFTNYLAGRVRGRENEQIAFHVIGNAFASVNLFDLFTLKTSLGMDYQQRNRIDFYLPPPPCTVCNEPYLEESWSRQQTTTWTNTLTFSKRSGNHRLGALLGYEVIHGKGRNFEGFLADYFVTGVDSRYLNPGLADPNTLQAETRGDIFKLASLFGKLDYSFADKYIFSFTLRHDGSSKFGNDKYGTFPAASFGWRISGEPFLQGWGWLTDLKFRIGLGVTGGQNIPSGNAFDRFRGAPGTTFYDLFGLENSVVTGFALAQRGNPETQWERSRTVNAGVDLTAWAGRFSLVLDGYIRTVDGLLFNPILPGTAGSAQAPFVNIAEIRNSGIDLNIQYRGNISPGLRYDIGLTATHYRNEIIKVSDDTDFFYATSGFRDGTNNINMVGYPVSAFYGYLADGIFQDQAEVDGHAVQPSKTVGRLRFQDLEEDGMINEKDKQVIGHPHPDLLLGLNLTVAYRGLDLALFLFASLGNQIYNYSRYALEFGNFGNNVTKEALQDSWRPDNPDARIPLPHATDAFSSSSSTYYLEDGTYLRLKTLQIGYSLPSGALQQIGLDHLRFYLQAQNLFTLTSYSGLDPALTNVGLREDLTTGYDEGTQYPASRIFSFGVNLEF